MRNSRPGGLQNQQLYTTLGLSTGKRARQAAGQLVGRPCCCTFAILPTLLLLPRLGRLWRCCTAIVAAAAILLPIGEAGSASVAVASQAEAADVAADGGGQALGALWRDDQIGEEPAVQRDARRKACNSRGQE